MNYGVGLTYSELRMESSGARERLDVVIPSAGDVLEVHEASEFVVLLVFLVLHKKK